MKDFKVGDKVESTIVETINGTIKEVRENCLIVNVRGNDMVFSKDYVKIIKE